MTCNLFSGSRPIFFEWNKNGQKFSGTNNIRMENTNHYSLLTMTDLTAIDSGNYECIAKNAYGSASTSTQFVIKGWVENYFFYLEFMSLMFSIRFYNSIGKPKLMPFNGDLLELVENMTFPLNCALISGSKPIFFEWYRNGERIIDRIKIDNQEQISVLSLSNIQTIDSGKYECLAKNQFGQDSIATNILVKGLLFNLIIICSSLKTWRYLVDEFINFCRNLLRHD
ncbi:hypothetical protein BLA29_007107 [Euroglyphus maynei]|uniref:Ig-like domain-containing protein n=1 Tax=Euroglyphus maynei TaxID=6958 RepID=A0A1Y3AXD1_EURMA|nr:hypothetical protein BLA29_007107 [Euroglyphus maynei]